MQFRPVIDPLNSSLYGMIETDPKIEFLDASDLTIKVLKYLICQKIVFSFLYF